ncbi:MAG: rhomboid family intramembrane serine protease [Deltaproteobacteria bacterium]|nr:rhomboid family intramembrane serine protease [Deltaproteobacteria bacterium]
MQDQDSLQAKKILRFSDHRYLFHTWTGRLLLLCATIWLLMAITTQSFLSPTESYIEWLFRLGAKEPVAMAQGQWWRLFNPIFLHYNILHLFLNMMALRFVGRIVEYQTGSGWFLFIFLSSGIQGNLWSAASNTSLGMGASGAIFGLVGFMIIPEYLSEWQRFRSQGRSFISENGEHVMDITPSGRKKFRWIPGPFAWMGLLNIALAILINVLVSVSDDASFGIDNAAHLGGLCMGLSLGLAYLFIRPNGLLRKKKAAGFLIIALSFAGAGGILSLLQQSDRIKTLLFRDALTEKHPANALRKLQRILLLDPSDGMIYAHQGRILLEMGEWQWAEKLIRQAARDPRTWSSLETLLEEQKTEPDAARSVQILEFILKEARGSSL